MINTSDSDIPSTYFENEDAFPQQCIYQGTNHIF